LRLPPSRRWRYGVTSTPSYDNPQGNTLYLTLIYPSPRRNANFRTNHFQKKSA